jgi:hypothetical protein
MADWIDTLSETVFRVTELFLDSDRPKRMVGIVFASLTAFGIIGTLIAICLGTKLDPLGCYFLIPVLLASTSISVYCLVTDDRS